MFMIFSGVSDGSHSLVLSYLKHVFSRGMRAFWKSPSINYSKIVRVGFRSFGVSAFVYVSSTDFRYFTNRYKMRRTLPNRALTSVYSFLWANPAFAHAFSQAVTPFLLFLVHVMHACKRFFTSLKDTTGGSVSCLASRLIAFESAVLKMCAQQRVCRGLSKPRAHDMVPVTMWR